MSTDIAVIGYSCRLPGCENAEEYWRHINNGDNLISAFSKEELIKAEVPAALYNHPKYVGKHGAIKDIECFDASFFNMSPVEAMALDPQQRLFMQCCWEALEHAAYNPDDYSGLIGLFAGCGINQYLFNNVLKNQEIVDKLGAYTLMQLNDKDFLSTRTAFKLNLRGPALTVQTACSTSLVAIHQACQSILLGDSDIAIAGGVSLAVPQTQGYVYQEGMILSSDGVCRPFDADANGTVIGSGVVSVVLKALADAKEDGDFIHAVIKGSALGNDGGDKSAYTAPSVSGQRRTIEEALESAGVSAQDISYIETHGTATKLGDPIEFEALRQVFESQTNKKQFCALGSVKGNIGHTDTAAGCAGFLKTVLALSHKTLPPSLNYQRPNPHITIDDSPFFINTIAGPWVSNTQKMIMAGVSSFGIGGTNAHVIVEQGIDYSHQIDNNNSGQYITLSAKDEDDLSNVAERLKDYLVGLKENGSCFSLADIAYSLKVGRKSLTKKALLIVNDLDDLLVQLSDIQQYRHKVLVSSKPDIKLIQDGVDILFETDFTGVNSADLGGFVEAVEALLQQCNVNLSSLKKAPISRREYCDFLLSLLWLSDVSISWEHYYLDVSSTTPLYRVPLPSYPFKKVRHWIESQSMNTDKNHKEETRADISNNARIKNTKNSKNKMFDWFYEPAWSEQPLVKEQQSSLSGSPLVGTVLFIHSKGVDELTANSLETAICNSLVHNGAEVINVYISDNVSAYEKMNPTQYQCGFGNAGHYKALLEDLQSSNRLSENIIYMAPLTVDSINQIDAFEHFSSLLELSKVLLSLTPTPALRLNVLINELYAVNQNDKLNPYNAILPSLLISMPQEHPSIACRCIDIGAASDLISQDKKIIADQISSELRADQFDPTVAYRQQSRWVENFEPIQLSTNSSLLITSGVYIITGGLGHIGLMLAEYLSQRVQATIVLINRSAFPAESEWQTCLNDNNTDELLQQKIRSLINIQQQGSVINIIQADVADELAMESAFDKVEQEYGDVNGVIHAAGIINHSMFCPVNELKEYECKIQWHPKIDGTQVIGKLIAQRSLDFCLLMSSLSSTLGGLGFSAYAAANAFMDAYCHEKNVKNEQQTSWISINWDAWAQTNNVTDPLAISAEESAKVFDYIFSSHQKNRVLVSTYSLEQRVNKWLKKNPTPESVIENNYRNNLSSRLDTLLIELLSDFLQLDNISVDDDFFNLGGDSLLAVSFIDTINRQLNTKLPVSVLMEARSIRELVIIVEQHIDGHVSELPFCMVKLKNDRLISNNSNKPPLFLIHPVGGAVYFYQDIAAKLDNDQMVYGIQAQALDGVTTADKDLKAMATRYVAALKVVQTTGPYCLGGASLGGMVAYEMAQQLQAAGEQVSHLFLIDTPSEGFMPKEMNKIDDVIHYLLNVGENLQVNKSTLSEMTEQEKLDFLANNLSQLPESFKQQQQLLMAVFNANIEAMRNYKTKQIDCVRGVFFAPEEANDYHPLNLETPWFTRFKKGLDVIRIPGNHLTMNRSNNAEKIARFIQLYINTQIVEADLLSHPSEEAENAA